MSWQAALLNRWLAAVERPALARVEDAVHLRQRFLKQARLFFRPPKGTKVKAVTLGGVDAAHVVPPGAVRRTLLYLHGGAYIFGAPETHSAMAARIGQAAQAEVILPRYPLAPEHPFPAACHAVRRVWDHLEPRGPTVLGGDSAGGGLTFGLLHQLIADQSARPDAVFALSPLTDMTFSGVSLEENAKRDVLLEPKRVADVTAFYLPDGTSRQDARVSPLFGDFNCSPPVWLTVGDTEILRDDTFRMAAHLRDSAVDVTQHTARNLPHVWPIFHNYLPEARSTIARLGRWIKDVTPTLCEN